MNNLPVQMTWKMKSGIYNIESENTQHTYLYQYIFAENLKWIHGTHVQGS